MISLVTKKQYSVDIHMNTNWGHQSLIGLQKLKYFNKHLNEIPSSTFSMELYDGKKLVSNHSLIYLTIKRDLMETNSNNFLHSYFGLPNLCIRTVITGEEPYFIVLLNQSEPVSSGVKNMKVILNEKTIFKGDLPMFDQ